MAHNKIFLADPSGNVVFPGEQHRRQYPWVELGPITAVVAAGQAPIDDDKRADADVVNLDATKKIIYEPDDGTVAFEFRVRADGTEDDDLAIQLLAAAGVDHYTKVSDLTCTQGKQNGHTTEKFIDAIAQANNDWETTPRVVDAQAEHIARYVLNTHGHDRFLWVCTDKQNANNIWIDVRRK